MSFQTKTWADGEAGGTPITAAELNRIEQGIAAASAEPEIPDPSWDDVTGKPSTFTPATHTHSADDIGSGMLNAARIPTLAQSKITGLSDALDSKADASTVNSLTTTVEGKADSSALAALEARIEALEALEARIEALEAAAAE